MRHVWSLIAGIVVAPLAWALLAMGQSGTSATITAWTNDNAFDTADLIKPAAYLVAAGVLLGLVATLRISPLGALVAGLAYLGLNVALFIDPFATVDAVPNTWKPFGETVPLRAPLVNGTLAVIGALLVIASFSAKRWRTWPEAAAVVPADDRIVPADEEPTVVEPPAPADQPTAVIPPPPPTYPPVSPARVPDSEAATEPMPRHAASPTSVPSAPPPPPSASYGDDAPTSPWAAPPPRQSDRD